MKSSIRLSWGSKLGGLVYVLGWSVWVVVGCSPTITPAPLPTLTLIPATATYTPSPVSIPATLPARTDPDDLLVLTATPERILVPAGVQPLVQLAVADLSEQLAISSSAITLIELQEATWASLDFGCGEERPLYGTSILIPGYRLVFEVADNVYAYHTDKLETVRRCDRADVVIGETQTLLDIDPVATELVLLSQRRAATLFEVTPSDVEVVSVRAYRWTDASLGCPLPDITYAPVEIDGYRIVLEVGAETVLFHTNFEQIIRCDPENEVLPDQD